MYQKHKGCAFHFKNILEDMSKLAILIPTLDDRINLFERSTNALNAQINYLSKNTEIKIFSLSDNGKTSTGEKRNILVREAFDAGYEYAAHFDDDDLPADNYMQNQYAVTESGMDCGSFWGQIYWEGKKGKPFHHSIKYPEWFEDDKYYYRCVNHLNCVRLDILKDYPFPDQTFGEDGIQSMSMKNAGVLKTEYQINEIMYHYFCGKIKNPI